jgi:hypothetical protein
MIGPDIADETAEEQPARPAHPPAPRAAWPLARHAADPLFPQNNTHQAIQLLIDVGGLLDYLFRAPIATGELAQAAETYLHVTLSHYTLDTLIDAVDNLAAHLTEAMRQAITAANRT